MTIQDWPLSYDELEPYYDRFEKLCGTSGKAGNIKGQAAGRQSVRGLALVGLSDPAAQAGPLAPTLFAEAARKTGQRRFRSRPRICARPTPIHSASNSANARYCGFCERFGCGNYAKSSPQTCVLPALLRFPNFSAQTESEVTKINLDATGKRATGVTYVDTSGEEWEQPADIVLVCAFSLFNVRLLLLSGIGKPYDPQTGQGVVGRNYAYQTTSSVSAILKDKILNPFIASGAHGMIDRRLQRRQFRSHRLGFVGGG